MDDRSRIEQLERENEELRHRLAVLTREQPKSLDARLDRLLRDRIVLENLPDIVSILDREMRVVYVTRTIQGRTVDEMIGTCSTEHLAEPHRARFVECFEKAWTTAEPVELEFATRSDYRWISRFVPVIEEGTVVFLLTATTDVTSQRRAQEALVESEMHLRQVIEASGMGAWSWNAEGDVVTWDARLREIIGVAEGEPDPTYRRYLEYVSEDDRSRVSAAIASSIETGVYRDIEHRVVRPDGTERHVLCKGFVLRDADGKLLGLRGGVFDITDRHALETELREVQKMEAIGRLTSGIAHNFNNLLGIILPSVHLARRAGPDAIRVRLDDIEHAAERASEMVRDLMLFARGGAAERRAEDAVALTQRTAAIAKTTFSPAITIGVDVPEPVPAVIANAGQIEQVLLNILLNARDALEDGRTARPRIGIRIELASGTHLAIRISDNGPGMDETTRSKVFEPFFTTKAGRHGTGLGLASAYAIVADHGGRIHCESTKGVGTTFCVELPIAEGPAMARAVIANRVSPSGSERVLVVDDEPAFRRVLRAILESAGFAVVEAEDGLEGLDRIARAELPFDVVIADRAMPRLDGEGLIREMQKRGSAPPVILLSGSSVIGATDDADAVLGKPITDRALLEEVRAVIDRAGLRKRGRAIS